MFLASDDGRILKVVDWKNGTTTFLEELNINRPGETIIDMKLKTNWLNDTILSIVTNRAMLQLPLASFSDLAPVLTTNNLTAPNVSVWKSSTETPSTNSTIYDSVIISTNSTIPETSTTTLLSTNSSIAFTNLTTFTTKPVGTTFSTNNDVQITTNTTVVINDTIGIATTTKIPKMNYFPSTSTDDENKDDTTIATKTKNDKRFDRIRDDIDTDTERNKPILRIDN